MFPRRSAIAVVEVYGTIGLTLRVPTVLRLLDTVERTPRFRALVLDIDSPGGTVPGSEQVFLKARRIASTRPVVAFIRNVGASGGYYIACGANRIVALPTALTGSIGVLSVHASARGLLSRLGLHLHIYKAGRHKDMTGIWHEPSPEEQEKYQALVSEIYENFVGVVVEARKMERDRVRQLATGEVFTGARARELGLVDELGDFDRALDLASELGRVARRPVWVRPRERLIRRLLGRYVGPTVADVLSFAGSGPLYLAPGMIDLRTP